MSRLLASLAVGAVLAACITVLGDHPAVDARNGDVAAHTATHPRPEGATP